jgi:hypothetical protein
MVLDLWDIKVIIENNNPYDAFDIIKKKALKLRAEVERLWQSPYAHNLYNYIEALNHSIEACDWVLKTNTRYMT